MPLFYTAINWIKSTFNLYIFDITKAIRLMPYYELKPDRHIYTNLLKAYAQMQEFDNATSRYQRLVDNIDMNVDQAVHS